MRLRLAVIAVGAALGLAGCGSDRDQVTDKVQQLAQAVRSHNYKAICDQVLAPALVNRLVGNGIPCPQAIQLALQGVEEPVISIGKIDINGSRATAITLTVARGQQATLAAIELVKTGQGWRISALGSPLSGGRS